MSACSCGHLFQSFWSNFKREGGISAINVSTARSASTGHQACRCLIDAAAATCQERHFKYDMCEEKLSINFIEPTTAGMRCFSCTLDPFSISLWNEMLKAMGRQACARLQQFFFFPRPVCWCIHFFALAVQLNMYPSALEAISAALTIMNVTFLMLWLSYHASWSQLIIWR